MRGKTLTFYLYDEEIALIDTISSLDSPDSDPVKMRSRTVGVGILTLGEAAFRKVTSSKKRVELVAAINSCKGIYAKHNVHRIGNNGAAKVSDKARKVRV